MRNSASSRLRRAGSLSKRANEASRSARPKPNIDSMFPYRFERIFTSARSSVAWSIGVSLSEGMWFIANSVGVVLLTHRVTLAAERRKVTFELRAFPHEPHLMDLRPSAVHREAKRALVPQLIVEEPELQVVALRHRLRVDENLLLVRGDGVGRQPRGGPGRPGSLGHEDRGVGDQRADLTEQVAHQVDAVRLALELGLLAPRGG